MSLRRTLLAVLGLTLLIGLALSEESLDERSKSMLFSYEDSISGQGNFASNNKIAAQGPHADARVQSRLAGVTLQKKYHGSGSIERESIITSKELTENKTNPDMIYAYGMVAALYDCNMVYAPETIFIDNGYYASHIVNVSSLLGDMTQIKNYASKTLMGHEVNYAHVINMDLVSSVEDDYSGWEPSKGLARSRMELDESVTDGFARLEMLQGGTRMSKSAWSRPNIYVDQVYTGTFDFATKMNLTLPVTKIVSEDAWLPCCSCNWVDMASSDKKSFGWSAERIFDCTCFKKS